MKARFLALAALLFGMAACQTEPAFDVNMGDGTTTISVVLPEDAITRTAADETNSAWGGLLNEKDEELAVTLYIFDENGNPSVDPHTTTLTTGTTVANFQVRLVPDRHYTFVAWAGQKSAEGLFTLGTRELGTLAQNDWTITLSDWTAMNEQRDAFTGIYSTAEMGEKFTSASNINLTLTRPFAKVRVVTTDMEWLNNINVTPAYAEVSYEVELPQTFNAYTQTIGDEDEVFTKKEHQTFAIKDYTKDADGSMTLFTDYILVPESGNVKFTLDVYEDAACTKLIKSNAFTTDIPVKRNNLTTIAGNILTDGNNIKVTVEEDFANAQNPNDKPYYIEYKEAGSAQALVDIINEINNSTTNEQTHISLTGDIDIDDLLSAGTLSTRASDSKNIKIANGKVIELDLKGFTISGTDKNTAGNFYLINNCGTLTISDSSEAKTGAIKLSATTERNWNASSVVVANNPGGLLVVDGGLIEHLGGTSMAYGVDNLTNGKGTYAETVINGGTIKSTYRAVRQFLNGVEAQNILTVNGGVIEGANKSIWMQDPSKNANTGKLTVKGGELRGNVYLTVTEGSATWPVEVSIAASTLANGSEVLSSNVPAGYDVVEKNGNWVVEYGVEENGNEVTILNAGGLKWLAAQVNGGNYFAGKTVKLGADIDLNNENWTPIGSAYADHGFMGNFDGNGYVIKNLAITEIAADSDGYVYAGLFGVTEGTDKDNQNYIKNLVIENVNIETTGHIAAAAIAYPYYTKLENIKVQGNVTIKGGDYTAGVLAYTRRCVDAKNISIEATNGSIEGNMTVGGVISDIQMNGGLTANYSNFAASGLTIKAVKSVGGISGIICNQTLNGATVKNVNIVCENDSKGIVAGSNGGDYSKINNASYENVTGATRIIGATYGSGAIVVDNADDMTAALAGGKDVYLYQDVRTEAATTAPYGNKYAFKFDGGVIDGNNHELYMECYGDDYGIMTTGGTIKNLTITEGCRAVMIMYPKQDVVLDNVKIGGDGVLYPINTGEAGSDNVNLIVTNSELAGWTSYGLIKSATFTNVEFKQGTYYNNIYGRVLKPYVNTTLTDCSFVEHMNLDLSSLKAGHKIVMKNCTVNGQAVNAEVFTIPTTDAQYDTELFTIDLPSWATSINDCVVFE